MTSQEEKKEYLARLLYKCNYITSKAIREKKNELEKLNKYIVLQGNKVKTIYA